MPSMLQSLFNSPALSRVRRNHALEHATIHLLSRTYPQRSFVGRSDSEGFYIYGDVETHHLEETVSEAITRLRNGEYHLAYHPNCGTNLVTSGLLAGGASFFALMGSERNNWRQRLDRLPGAVLLTMGALLVAQPLGRLAQVHLTVQADPGDLHILAIRRVGEEPRPFHRIVTSTSHG